MILNDEELERALAELRNPTGTDAFLRAFSTLLHSDNTAAVGMALDYYRHAEALTRFGGRNPLESFANEVLIVARDLLRRPPAPGDEDTKPGADHASALNVMTNPAEAEAEDADLIADAIEGATDVNVRSAGFRAAAAALTAGSGPNPRLLAVISAMVFDETLDVAERREALSAVDMIDTPEVDDLLVRASESSELDLQIGAALQLSMPIRLRTHREQVERLAASWPTDMGGYASIVREQLAGFHSIYWTGVEPDDPKLRKAHWELMFPTSDETCLQAFLTLLRSDDMVAVGVALDHYEHWEGLRRVLDDETSAERYLPEVLDRAREVLRQPPSPPELSPNRGAGANHLSALNMIGARHAEPSDADLVLDVLEQAATDEVRHEAVSLAYGVLDEAEVKDQRVVDALSDLLFDPSIRFNLAKEKAIRVLADALGPEADGLLLRLVRGDDAKAQAHAAWYLVRSGRLDKYRDLLVEVAESWGDCPPAHPHGHEVIERLLGKLHSWYWQGRRLADPDLYRAHRELRAPTSDEAYHRALRALLDSGDQVAVGIALDHWWHPEGLEKQLGVQARDAEASLVLNRVLETLRDPPTPAELSPETGVGANHLSALQALCVSGADEAPPLADVLESAANDSIRCCALDAVKSVFDNSEEADPRLVEALGTVARDTAVPLSDRLTAIDALDRSPGFNSVGALVRATGCPEVEIQAAAAWGLMYEEVIDEHRGQIERLNANWPVDDVPWEVRRVRDLLEATTE
ncbi:hypothetical protein [Amycolatopsis taiwanensis]|uniref:hypothetical protein n=1 Tax=Amycolatopsis taiwanensis TaxID=342230 RepID=UPI0004817666|nr:hypothetical protein [Amycolatopsis taiwanensis]